MSRLYFILFLLLAQNILKAQTDTIPPSIFCPISDTVTLPAGGVCSFQYFYVVASSDELPGDTLVQLAGLPSGADFPLGNTVNIFQAIDAAGNTATCSFTLTVQNYVGPLVCKTNLSVSLDSTCAWTATAADLLTGAAGCTDSAYYLLEVDKTPPYGNGPWVAADFGQVDIGKTYVFRVSDTIYGYECQGSVQINDMLPPVLTCQDITISCAVDNVSPAFLKDSLGIAQAVPIVEDACDASPVFNFIDTETAQDCGSGFAKIINRKWTAQDGFGNSSTCVQQISLTRPTLADLRYPRDTTLAYCINADIPTTTTGLPYLEFAGKKFTNLCSLGATFSDSTIQISPCDKQILRTWFAVDWCNGSTLDTVQVIDVQDTVAVVFLNCPDSTLTLGDTTATNDPSLWNAPHWANPQTGMENLCEGQADLQIAALDACTNTHIRYLLFLDLDNNGTPETVVNSDNPPAPGTVNFGNAANPNYAGGESRSFDERAVDSILKYRFALQTIASGDTLTTRVVWNSDSLPSQFATPQLPHGTHKIKWIAQDSCGNESVCEYNFTIKDSRAPAVTCSSGLTVNFPPNQTCMLTIYAIDFLQEAEDNCTPPANLMFAVRRAGAGAGFPVDSSGNPNASITFVNPYDLGPQSVELWVKDLAGNAGFCTTSIDLQDPIGSCDPSFDLDAVGNVKTEFDTPVANATIAMAISTTSMNITLQTQTNQQGQFVFASSVPLGGNYTLTPSKNNNHLDGVTTFDLALISKHILGLETLSSPYKLIAADANKSNSVTTFDIVELRKLILGIYANLPQNTSWRFVDKDFVFPDPENPFLTPFPESITRSNVLTDQLEEDFVGVKIGDVNGSVLGDSLLVADDRTRGVLFFNVNDEKVEAGEEFTTVFQASEQVLGWQFTLNLKDLEVVEILPGEGISRDNFAAFADALTTSVEKPASDFAVTFRARRAGQLSEMLAVSSRITKAEAYSPSFELLDVALRFDEKIVSKIGFELYQNQPNPFSDRTLIGFHLPEACDATLTVFDETGRVLLSQSASCPRGYNSIVLEKSLFGNAGVLFYKLSTPTDSAVRKMVLLK